MKDLFRDHLNNEQLDEKFNDYLKFYEQNWLAFHDVIPCLKRLKKQNHRLGIISNGDDEQQVKKLESIHVKKYFDSIITSSEISVAKPHATIF